MPSTYEHSKKNADLCGGATGEPSKSSAEKGKIYHEHLIKNLVAVVNSLKAAD